MISRTPLAKALVRRTAVVAVEGRGVTCKGQLPSGHATFERP